jgi:alpha-L-fucosidase
MDIRMKYAACLIVSILFLTQVRAQFSGGGEANPHLTTHPEALKEFQDMRFGMFIHWGPVSLRGEEISWSRGREIPKEEYDQLYKEFNPEQFDATAWVATAKAAGMKYLVITSRHHDGFSLWDSKYTEYDMASTPYGRGVLKELSEACRKEGIVFGTYYSICDWYRPDYPVEYPSADYSFNEERIMDEATQQQMNHYTAFMKNQLEELIKEYNTSLIWFDGEWEWAWTHEMGMDMYAYLREMKENLLINNRVDKGRNGMVDNIRNPVFAGDYATPEQNIGTFDREFAWETCMTIGSQWAWKPNEKLKSKKECIHTLIQTIGGDGNLLFNVGPMPNGQIENRQVERLKEMGDWVSDNQEAIYGTRGGPWLPTKKLASTYKDNKIYLFLLEAPGKRLSLPLEEGIKVKKAYFLQNGQALDIKRDGEKITLTLNNSMPDQTASTLVLELDTKASEIQPTEL